MPDLIKDILHWYTTQKFYYDSYEAWVDNMMRMRDAKLIEVDAIERAIKMKPRTSEIRQKYKGN